jgi:uncharacterized protein (TIGR00730 family)
MPMFGGGRGKKAQETGTCRIPMTSEEQLACRQSGMIPHASEITWRVFRIMAELVEGFHLLTQVEQEVSVFGSSRAHPNSHWYREAYELGKQLGLHGFTVITGGGPGIMEAANKGAYDVGGVSVGLNIELPREQRLNPYTTHSRGFHYFFTRKLMLAAAAKAYVFFPGGFGTCDELFELLTLIQTGKSSPMPIILVGKEYWAPLMQWIEVQMYGTQDAIDPEDLRIPIVVDSAKEAFTFVSKAPDRNLF